MKYKAPKNIQKKESAKRAGLIFWKNYIVKGGLFLLTLLVTFISSFQLDKANAILPRTKLQDVFFLFLFVVFFISIFFIYKKAKKLKTILYKGIFIIVAFWGGVTILNLFLPIFGAVVIIGILIALWLELSNVWVQDILMILGFAGAASFFGLNFSPSIVLTLLLAFSLCDFIFVYKTKDAFLLSKEMVDNGTIFGLIIPKELKYFKDKILKTKTASNNFSVMWGADILFPSLLTASLIPAGSLKAILVAVFSMVGSFFGFWIASKQKDEKGKTELAPSLPPIALLTIIGYLISLFIP